MQLLKKANSHAFSPLLSAQGGPDVKEGNCARRLRGSRPAPRIRVGQIARSLVLNRPFRRSGARGSGLIGDRSNRRGVFRFNAENDARRRF